MEQCVNKIVQIKGVKYEVSAFHPLKFEEGIYAVSFHEKGKPFLDKYHILIQVMAKNAFDAIKIAKSDVVRRKK